MKVSLLSGTENPLATLWHVWHSSRNNEPVEPEAVAKTAERMKSDATFEEEVVSLFRKVIASGIPVAESIQFVFLLEGIPISLREQLVRHRVGVKVGERLGVDMIPDLAASTWWSQSMRVLEMGEFAQRGEYFVPESILQDQGRMGVYDVAMQEAEQAYQRLVEKGVPLEDARNVLPLGVTHRLTWALNLGALKHIVGKRGCWILQLGIWEPVIVGMVEQLATRVHPAFRELIDPPCFHAGKWDGCKFRLDNQYRFEGKDPLPPCTLWASKHREELLQLQSKDWCLVGKHLVAKHDDERGEELDNMENKYRQLWQREPLTGEKL